MNKVIELEFTDESIDNAIKEIDKFYGDFMNRVFLFRDRVCEEITDEAQETFNVSSAEESWISGVPGSFTEKPSNVSVSWNRKTKNISVVIASGSDAVWIEFGTGVYNNGAAGTSPHPMGAGLGMTIGSYGKGKGKRKVWGYYDSAGVLHKTHGVEASMPMYSAAMNMIGKVRNIALEVFK